MDIADFRKQLEEGAAAHKAKLHDAREDMKNVNYTSFP